jgi:hypothetical protein
LNSLLADDTQGKSAPKMVKLRTLAKIFSAGSRGGRGLKKRPPARLALA